MEKAQPQTLAATTGISIPKPLGENIVLGLSDLIILPKLYKSEVDQLQYLMEDGLCYGMIRLMMPDKINTADFKSLSSRHNLSFEDAKKWWQNKEVLFAYPFEVVKMFETPKNVKITEKDEFETFVKNFEFDEKTNPLSEFRVLSVMYGKLKSGTEIAGVDSTSLINAGKKVFNTLIENKIDIAQTKMSEFSREFYDKVLNDKVERLDCLDTWAQFDEEAVVLDNFITMDTNTNGVNLNFNGSGSLFDMIETSISKTYENWDQVNFNWTFPTIVCNSENKDKIGNIDRAALEAFIIANPYPKDDIVHDWADKNGYATDDVEAALYVFATEYIKLTSKKSVKNSSNSVPLYKLKLEKVSPKFVNDIKNMETISSNMDILTPDIVSYDVDEIVSYLYSSPNKYAIEPNFSNNEFLISKTNEGITISSNSELPESVSINELSSKLNKLSNKNFIVQSMLDHKNQLVVYDCLFFDKCDLRDRDWFERKQILHSFNFPASIKESSSIIVNNIEEAKQAINILNNINSNGVVIKSYNGVNSKYLESVQWLKYTNKLSREYIPKEVAKTVGDRLKIDWNVIPFDEFYLGINVELEHGKIDMQTNVTNDNLAETAKIAWAHLKELKDYYTRLVKMELQETLLSERNEKFFDKWSPDMAYLLGFISTDGHIDLERSRIELQIEKKDRSILDKLASKLGKDSVTETDGGHVKFRFGSIYMANRLKEIGMDGLKKGRRAHDKVPEKFKWDFAKGAFDGDGTVVNGRIQFDTENVSLVKWMYERFKEIVGDEAKFYDYTEKHSIAKAAVLGDAAQKVLTRLGTNGLKRKEQVENSEGATTSGTAGIGSVQGRIIKGGDEKPLKPSQYKFNYKV